MVHFEGSDPDRADPPGMVEGVSLGYDPENVPPSTMERYGGPVLSPAPDPVGAAARADVVRQVLAADPRLSAPYAGQVPARLRQPGLEPVDTCALGRTHADGTPVRSTNEPLDRDDPRHDPGYHQAELQLFADDVNAMTTGGRADLLRGRDRRW